MSSSHSNYPQNKVVTPSGVSGMTPTATSSTSSTNALELKVVYRITPHKEYIKVVLKNGRVVGALLIGL